MKARIIMMTLVGLIFAMSADYALGQVEKKIIKIDKSGKGAYLGVELQDVTKKLKDKKNLPVEKGAYVVGVVEDSPAESAGLEKGDLIVRFGDEAIEDSEDLTSAVRGKKPKTEVKIEFYRDGAKKSISAVLGKTKGAQAYSFNLDDGKMKWFGSPQAAPKLSRKFKINVFSNNETQGLQLQPLTKQLGEYFGAPGGRGVLVGEVEKGSDAEKAGFRAGDVIVKANGRSIDDMDELDEEFDDSPGKEMPFGIIRAGKEVQLKMTIEEEGDDDADEDEEWSDDLMGGSDCHIWISPGSADHFRLQELKCSLRDLKEKIEQSAMKIRRKLKENLEEM